MKTSRASAKRGEFLAEMPPSTQLASSQVDSLIAQISDIALVLDEKGTICDASVGSDDLMDLAQDGLLGKSWFDVVTEESHPKLTDLLVANDTDPTARWRQVTHRRENGSDVPVKYASIKLGANGHVLAVGKNMQAIAEMQQNLVQTQLMMEREYARMQGTENLFRLLFQLSSEAIVVVETVGKTVVEANSVAGKCLGMDPKDIVGSNIAQAFASECRDALQALLSDVAGNVDHAPVSLTSNHGSVTFWVSGSPFRHAGKVFLILRLEAADNRAPALDDSSHSLTENVIDALRIAFVITDQSGEVLRANDAFLDMIQAASEDQIVGRRLSRWLGRSSVDFSVILANLKEHELLQQFSTSVRNQFDIAFDVTLSAVSVPEGEQPCIGFIIQNDRSRELSFSFSSSALPEPAGNLTELVGRVPMKDIVSETTDIIEKLCIEAALELTGNNRASAAEILGLSRQSLYVKLRRFGMGDRT